VGGGATVVVFAEEPGVEEVLFEEEPGVEEVPFEEGAGAEEEVFEGVPEEDGTACLFPLALQTVETYPAALGMTWKVPEHASPAEPAQTRQNWLSP